MTKSTVIKALGGIGLVAAVTLGATACGQGSSSHTMSVEDARSAAYWDMTAGTWAAESAEAQHNTTNTLLAQDGASISSANAEALSQALKAADRDTNAYQVITDLNGTERLRAQAGYSLGIPSDIWTGPAPVAAPTPVAPATVPPAPAPLSDAQAYAALQGHWIGTSFDATVSPIANEPGLLTTSMGGTGVPGANQIIFSGVQAGSGSLKLTYDFAANANTITVDTMGDGTIQATRASAPTTVPPTSAPAVPAHDQTDPWAVVSEYYGDITSGDYPDAWNLLGPSMQAKQSSYSKWVAGYSGTGGQTVTEISETANQVNYDLESINPDGTTQWYSGFAIVQGGQIQSTSITQLAGNPNA